MLPVEPGCIYDIYFSKEKDENLLAYPQTDETKGQDSWLHLVELPLQLHKSLESVH